MKLSKILNRSLVGFAAFATLHSYGVSLKPKSFSTVVDMQMSSCLKNIMQDTYSCTVDLDTFDDAQYKVSAYLSGLIKENYTYIPVPYMGTFPGSVTDLNAVIRFSRSNSYVIEIRKVTPTPEDVSPCTRDYMMRLAVDYLTKYAIRAPK